MTRSIVQDALDRGAAAERIGAEAALALAEDLSPDAVHRLGRAALACRRKRFGEAATYVFNVHVNPSNICAMGCTFCNYAASPRAEHAYVLDEEEIYAEIEAVRPVEAHIVGGLNPIWHYERNLALVAGLRRRFPALHIKAYTAVEIAYFARTAGTDAIAVLKALQDAGMDAMPGGGAEIFSERLHRRHWKNKIGPGEWLRIHGLAHGLGLPTNATMLFGFGDTWAERVEHLLRLREAQDRTGGFECFIPLPFQPGPGCVDGPSPTEVLAVIALSRLLLDNVPHIKAYWPMTGLAAAAAGLSWGADDMDGTIRRERIAHLAGATTPRGLARSQMVETIATAGFSPVERDGRFRPAGPPPDNRPAGPAAP